MKTLNRFVIFAVVTLLLSLTVTVVTAQEPVTLDVWTFADTDAIMPSVIEAFEAQYPNITIRLTDVPEDDYITKLDTALLVDEPPDVAVIYDLKWVASGDFLPLNDVIAAQGIDIDDFNMPALVAGNCYLDGQVYCMGSYTGAVLLFYNKDLLDAAGIAYPSATEPLSVDQYAEMARALTTDADNFEDRVWGSNAQGFWFLDFRNYYSEDIRTADGYVNDEATVHALQVMADIVTDGTVISSSDASQFAGDDLLISGQLATTITDNAYAIPLLENTEIGWGAAVPPVEQIGDPPHADQWTDGLGVPSASDNPEEAALFVAFWGSEGSRLRMEVTGDLPLNLAMAEEMNWAGDSEGRRNALDAIKASTPRVFVPLWRQVFESIEVAFYVYMLEDGMSAQEALELVTPVVQENLDMGWETWDSLQDN